MLSPNLKYPQFVGYLTFKSSTNFLNRSVGLPSAVKYGVEYSISDISKISGVAPG